MIDAHQVAVKQYHAAATSIVGITSTLAKDFPSITVGFEGSAEDWRLKKPITLDLNSGHLGDLLDSIVDQRPNYQWTQSDGEIFIRSRSISDSLLNTTIKSYSVSESNGAEALWMLLRTTEVRAWLAQHGVQLREIEEGSSLIQHQRPTFSINLENVSVRRVLGEIAKKSGTHQWKVLWYGDKHDFVGIYI